MTLLYFFTAIILAFGIARFNESNKLFWELMISFMLGYAGTVMVDRTINGSKRSNESLVQVCPTQTPNVASSNNSVCLLADAALAPAKVTALKSVVQDITPEEREIEIIPSEVFGRTRDQPQQTLTQPPECLKKSISTHHDVV